MTSLPAFTLKNQHLLANFEATGDLLELRANAAAPNLIEAMYCHATSEGMTTSEKPDEGQRPFRLKEVAQTESKVTTTLQSNEVIIERTFTLGQGDALLSVTYRIRPLKSIASLDGGAFPQINFAPGFANAFEDERDLYCDGAELGDGRELPCWRVFFQDKKDAGLIIATRDKAGMSHLCITAQSLKFLPHVALNYSTNYHLLTAPISFMGKARRGYEVAFEIGPWTRRKHQRILQGARLEQPTQTKNPPPTGKPPAKPKGQVIFLHRVVTTGQASRKFSKDRWLVARVPWAQQGMALVANTGVKPPPIVVDPKLRGVYRVFAGVGDSVGVQLKISGEPEPIFRLLSVTDRKDKPTTAFSLHLSGRHRAYELDCGIARLDGRTLSALRFPDLHRFSTLEYLRFEPLDDKQTAQWERAQSTPPRTLLTGMADAPDITLLLDALNPRRDVVTSLIHEHARCGYHHVYWRIDGQCCDYPSKVSTMRPVSARVHGMFEPQSKAYGRLLRKYDLLQTVVDAGRKYGVEIWGWMRFNFYGGNVQSEFFKQHPEYHEVWESGYRASKLCLAFPEVRQHKIDILLEAARYGLQGVNLGFLRHSPVLHYHPILISGYKERYGKEPPLVYDQSDPGYRFNVPPMNEETERWYRYRAEFITQFGRDLKSQLREAGLGHAKVSIWVRPNHCLYDGIDMDAWLDEGLCDEVVAGASTYVDEPLPVYEPTAQWREQVLGKVPLLRSLWAHDVEWAKRNAPRLLDEGYNGLSTYESNMAVIDPRFIDFYQSLRK